MPRPSSGIALAARAVLPVLFLALFGISSGIGLHRVFHLSRAEDALAHDAGCTTDLRMTTPAANAAGCSIVRGTIQRAYETSTGSQYGGGLAYDHFLVFAPQPGGATVTVRTGRTYSPQRPQPGGRAVAEYVDGEIDHMASESGTIGPIFDPATDKDFGVFLIGLGAFFGLIGAGLAAGVFFRYRAVKR